MLRGVGLSLYTCYRIADIIESVGPEKIDIHDGDIIEINTKMVNVSLSMRDKNTNTIRYVIFNSSYDGKLCMFINIHKNITSMESNEIISAYNMTYSTACMRCKNVIS